MKTLKEMVAGDAQVFFLHYRKGELWYTTEDGFQFPVPIDDTGDGTFLAQDRAMLFMRYIRKQLDAIKEEQSK
jgi:hypothetical protein